MKYSVKLSHAIHILAYIEMFQGTDLSSKVIAQSINSHPASVRKIMSHLNKSELINTQMGKANPKLSKNPSQITLFDILESVEKDFSLFHNDDTPAPDCIIGGNIQNTLADRYQQLQEILETEMAQITLEDIIKDISFYRKQEKSPRRKKPRYHSALFVKSLSANKKSLQNSV